VATVDDRPEAGGSTLRPRCSEALARYNAMADAIDAAQAWVPAMAERPKPQADRRRGRRTG
jgi:hypothetical protein